MSPVTVRWKSRTSSRAKLHKPTLPKLVPVPDGRAKRLGHGMMLIPTALEVDGMIRKIPRGQVSTLAQIRKRLARWHDVDVTCPLVTGIFLRIVAEAAEEDRLAGKSEITPYWRVVSQDGRLNTNSQAARNARPSTCVRKGTPSSTDESHWKRQPLPRLEIVRVIMAIITL